MAKTESLPSGEQWEWLWQSQAKRYRKSGTSFPGFTQPHCQRSGTGLKFILPQKREKGKEEWEKTGQKPFRA
jgi:hypothetical protein